MAKVTWLGEDSEGVAGPSFTTCFGRKFPKGEAIDLTDADIVRRASSNPFFSVETEGAEEREDLKSLTIAELRNLADASGISHAGMGKVELRDAILAHDKQSDVQDAG